MGTSSRTISVKVLTLVGMPGSGKSIIAERLSSLFDMTVLDSDTFIQAACKASINQIFKEREEPYFRALESFVVMELTRIIKNETSSHSKIDEEHKKQLTSLIEQSFNPGQNEPLVLSTGGGMPIHNNHMTSLKELGMVAYLESPAHVLNSRLNDDQTRPLLMASNNKSMEPINEKVNKERLGRITALLSEREYVYRQAHISIDTTFHSADEIAKELFSLFKSWKM